MRDDLGDWINRRLRRNLQGHEDTACTQIEESRYSLQELEKQWSDQKQAQLSVRSRK